MWLVQGPHPKNTTVEVTLPQPGSQRMWHRGEIMFTSRKGPIRTLERTKSYPVVGTDLTTAAPGCSVALQPFRQDGQAWCPVGIGGGARKQRQADFLQPDQGIVGFLGLPLHSHERPLENRFERRVCHLCQRRSDSTLNSVLQDPTAPFGDTSFTSC